MPSIYKVLGQVNPSATTPTTLYTVPASTSAVCSTLTIANLAASGSSFRISVRPGGEVQANKHYIAYDVSIAANDTIFLTLGMSLATGDVITVYALSSNLSFNLFGSEIS